jgi:hypothetical protein
MTHSLRPQKSSKVLHKRGCFQLWRRRASQIEASNVNEEGGRLTWKDKNCGTDPDEGLRAAPEEDKHA